MPKYFLLFLLGLFVASSASAAPDNDDFADAITISGTNISVIGDNTGSTVEPYIYSDFFVTTETFISFWGGGNSIWYKWVAPVSGSVTININSLFTPILDVYDGTGVTDISQLPTSPLAFNNISFVNGTSGTTTFAATVGTTYYIRIASFTAEANNGIGFFSLTLQEIAEAFSDSFATSTELYGDALAIAGSNSNATAEVNEPSHVKKPAAKSVWLKWTAPSHGKLELATTGSSFDTRLAVYTSDDIDPSVDSLTLVEENDNETNVLKTSKLSFLTVAGTTYYIAIDANNGGYGTIKFALDFSPRAPTVTVKPATQIVLNGDTATFTLTAIGTGTLAYQWQRAPAGSKVWTDLTNGTVSDLDATDLGVTYGGATTSALTVATVADETVPTNNDQFRCIITDTNGSTTSTTAKLIVTVLDRVEVTIRGPLGSVIDLTNSTPVPPDTVYYAKGYPKGFLFDPVTGQITAPTTVTDKPGTYIVTYGTTTTDINGQKTTTAPLTVVIVISPLSADASGGFEAILEDTTTDLPVGKVELLVNAATGTFTGKVAYTADAKVYSLKGTFALNSTYDVGTAQVVIARGTGLNPYRLDISLDTTTLDSPVLSVDLQQLDASATLVSATLADSDTGVQLATYTTAVPTPWQGRYTVVLDDPTTPPANLGLTTAPEGTGFGSATIKAAKGLLVFKGKLGDGTALTGSLAPSEDGSYRWYVKPYKTGGSFGGWIQFAPVFGLVAPYKVTGTANSELYWQKSASTPTDKSYRAGFGPIAITATAQLWTPPSFGVTLATKLQLTNGALNSTFTSASLPGADTTLLPTSLILGLDNKLTVALPVANADKFIPKVNVSTGALTGSLILQDLRKVTVEGVFLQQPTVSSGSVIAEGFFTIPPAVSGGEAVTGKVQFVAP